MSESRQFSIAIDGNEANVANRVGSNIYAFEVLKAIEVLTRIEPEVKVTVLLATSPVTDLPTPRLGWQYLVVGPKSLWTQFGLPIHLYFNRYDVLFSPGHYAPRLSPVPYVSSVMDLAFLVFPEQFRPKDLLQLKNWTAYSVKAARKVIAISEATKADVIKFYRRQPEDVVVAYPAVTPLLEEKNQKKINQVIKKYGLQKPYVLYVGTFQPRKNLIRLIEAFEGLCAQNVGVAPSTNQAAVASLVLAGKIGWLADDILARIKSSFVRERIILTGYVTDQEKQILYQEAAAAVLVGLYEGFGIPPLEAMQSGTVPVVSETTSLPEVVGHAGVLVNPYEPRSIASGLEKVLNLKAKKRAHYRRDARLQLKKFDWLESGRVILQTLKEVATDGR